MGMIPPFGGPALVMRLLFWSEAEESIVEVLS